MSTTEIDIEKLRIEVTKEVSDKLRTEYEAAFIKKVTEINNDLEEKNKVRIDKVLEEWKKEQTPPTAQELTQLLSQEYHTFIVKIPLETGEREFTIKELPQTIEKKLFQTVKSRILPRIKEMSNIVVGKSDPETKFASIIELFEPTFDLLAETVAVILNPYGKEEGVDSRWVQDNIASFRQWNIIIAQDHANRIRDFFFNASRTSQNGRMRGVGSLS